MRISILGCGWFGFPLAELLISKGYSINGSTTHEEKLAEFKTAGINPFLINLGDDNHYAKLPEFLEAGLLVINIPPGQTVFEAGSISHAELIKKIIPAIDNSPVEHVIYISSTSVYKNTGGLVTEDEEFIADEGHGYELVKAENMVAEFENFSSTILRFGGLYGYNRVPLRSSNDTVVVGDEKPMNLLHRDDAIAAVFEVIDKGLTGTFNVCQDEHPTKQEFIKSNPEILNEKEKVYSDSAHEYKIVSNGKFKENLSFEFRKGFKLT